MDPMENLSHTKWECKYHQLFVPKRRRKMIYEKLMQHLGEVFKRLAAQKESTILDIHLMSDHVHMLIAIPPPRAQAQSAKGSGSSLQCRVR